MFDPELNKFLTDEEVAFEIESEKKETIKETIYTAVSKVSFVKAIKNGLGEEIKRNPRGVIFIKKSWSERFRLWLTKIFTKF